MISIIIPVYNVEKYVIECLESIVASAEYASVTEEIEVILIDDGSSDSSYQLMEDYIKNQAVSFQLFKQINSGVAEARNQGLQRASHDYLTFIDPDDYIRQDYFEKIFALLKENIELDAIFFDIAKVTFDEKQPLGVFKGMDESDISSKWYANGSLASKILKTNLVKDIPFTRGLIYEDSEFSYKALSRISQYAYLEESLYFYRIGRTHSITTTRKTSVDDIYKVLSSIRSYYINQNHLTPENEEGLAYQFVKMLLWSNYYRQLKYAGFNIFDGQSRMAQTRQFLAEQFPNWSDNRLLEHSIYLRNLMGPYYLKQLTMIGENIFKTYYVFLCNQYYKRRK